jgi:signal transduction histidine kinase
MRVDAKPQPGKHLLPTLIAAFALLIGLLVASAYIGIGAIESAESDASSLVSRERDTLHLIEEIQQQQENLNAVFYSVASLPRRPADRERLLARLDELESHILHPVHHGIDSGHGVSRADVRQAAVAFIAEGRQTLRSGAMPSEAFFSKHERLSDILTEIANSNFNVSTAMEKGRAARSLQRIRYSLLLLGIALTLAITGAVFTVYTVHQMFRRLRWQATELAHLSSRSMSEQEESARRFSRELHDEFGQTLSAIEANLVSMCHARKYDEGRMEDCLGLIRDGIENARELSQLLRPSILDDFGLDASLNWLARTFSERTNIQVAYESDFSDRLEAETETQLFRIAQEALTNVARHANASHVRMELKKAGRNLLLTIADDGRGMPPSISQHGGLGLVGMRARARDAHASLRIRSSPGRGVTVLVEVSVEPTPNVQKDSHLVSR